MPYKDYAKGFIELVWAYYTEYKKGNINRIDGIIEFMTIISWAAIRPIEDTPLENGGFSYYRDERYWAKARYYYSMWDGSLNNENIYKKAYIFINKNDIKTVNIYCLAMKIYEIIARDPTYDPDDEDIFNKLNTNQEILDLLCKFPNLYKKIICDEIVRSENYLEETHEESLIQIPKVPFNKVFPSLCTSPIYAGEKGKFVSRAYVLYQIPCTYLEVPIERAPKYLITALYWYVNDRNKQNSFYELFMHYLKRAGYLKNGKKKDGKKTYSEFYTDSITKSNFDNIMQFQNASHEKVLIGQIVLKLKLKMNEAERLFWADGKVLVSQYGDEDYFIDTLIKYAIER